MNEQTKTATERCRYKTGCPYKAYDVCKYVCEEDIYIIREIDGKPEIRVMQHETYRAMASSEQAQGQLVEYSRRSESAESGQEGDWSAFFVTPKGFRFLFLLGTTVTKVTRWCLDYVRPQSSSTQGADPVVEPENLSPGYLLNLSVLHLSKPKERVFTEGKDLLNLKEYSEDEYDGDMPEQAFSQLERKMEKDNLYIVSWDKLPAKSDWNNPLMQPPLTDVAMSHNDVEWPDYTVSYISEEELVKCPLLDDYVAEAGEDSLIKRSKELLENYFYKAGIQVGAASTVYIGASNLRGMGICYVVNLSTFKDDTNP